MAPCGQKSQSALEYMMTYGWAILIIVIAAAIMYEMGIFNISPPVSLVISGFSGITVSTASMSSSQMGLQLQNIAGSAITIDSLNATAGGNTYTTYTCDSSKLDEGGSTLCYISGNFGSTNSFSSVKVDVLYTSSNVFSTNYMSSGSIGAKIAPFISGGPFQATNDIAYVSSWTGTLAEINTTDNKLITTIGNPTWGVSQIAFSANGSIAYEPDGWSTLGVFSTQNFSLIKKYWTAGCGDFYIDVPPNSKYAFVSLEGCGQNAVDVVNLSNPSTFSDFKHIGTLGSPQEMVTASNGDIYVADSGSNAVSVVNPATMTNVGNITSIGAPNAFDIAYDSKTNDVYVPSGYDNYNNISVISTSTNSIVGNVSGIGYDPQFMAMSNTGKFLYISNSFDWGNTQGSVSVMNSSSYVVVKNILVGHNPLGITVAPDGYIYVVNSNSNTVSVIDNTTLQVVQTISGNGLNSPQDVAVTDNEIFVTNWNGNTVSVFSYPSGTPTTTISVQSNPYVLAVSPTNSSEVYASNYGSNTVSVIDAATNSLVMDIGSINCNNPEGIAFTPNGQYAYIACYSSNEVSVINAVTNTYSTVIGSVTHGGCIRAVTVSHDGNYVYTGAWCQNNADVTKIYTANNTIALEQYYQGTDLSSLMFSSGGSRLFALFHWHEESPLVVYNPVNLQVETRVGNLLTICSGRIAISPNGEYAAEMSGDCNNEGAAMSMINLTSHKVMYTVNTGWGGNAFLAFSNDNRLAYLSTGAIIEAVNVSAGVLQYSYVSGGCPGPITVSPNGTVYETFTCGNSWLTTIGNNGVAIFTPQLRLIRYVYGPGIAIWGLATSPDLSKLYISGSGSSMTYMWTGSNHIPIPPSCNVPCSGDLGLVQDGNLMYSVQNSWSLPSVAVQNLSVSNDGSPSFMPLTDIYLNNTLPHAIAITPDKSLLYVASSIISGNYNKNGGLLTNSTVSVISTASNALIDTITAPGCPQFVKVTQNGKYALVDTQCLPSSSLLFIDTQTNSIVKTLPLGGCLNWLTSNANSTIAYVVNSCANQVDVVNLTSLSEIDAVGGGGLNNPQGIALTTDGKFAYIANWNTNQISVLNTSAAISDPSNAFLTPITIPQANNWRAVVIGAGHSSG